MSTFRLSAESIAFIGQAALSLARNGHKSSAWLHTSASEELMRACWGHWRKADYAPSQAEIIARALDTLYVFNQRAERSDNFKHGDFWPVARVSGIRLRDTNHLLSVAEYTQAYKSIQCLRYNMNQYGSYDSLDRLLRAFERLFICQLIDHSPEYQKAQWW